MKTRHKALSSLLLLVFSLFQSTTNSSAQPQGDEVPVTPTDTITIFMPMISTSNGLQTNPQNGIIINHQSVALFDSIPDSYIQAASRMKLLFRHASVGNNIDNGLNCMMDKIQPRPTYCDTDIPPSSIVYDPKYNRDLWDFEFHLPPPSQNPGWWEKVTLFTDRVDDMQIDYDVVAFKFGYVDAYPGSEIDNVFFANNASSPYPSIEDMEALEARHSDKVIAYWTIGLARLTYSESQNFNRQMRSYATQHGKVLMDFADIESHRPDGIPCYDNGGNGVEALCQEYTEEINGGHLNALGTQRMAKAIWVFMARLAGWDGQP